MTDIPGGPSFPIPESPPPPPPPEPAAPAPEYATRRELEALTRQIQQLSQIQLHLMNQLSQLLAAQPVGSPNGRVAP